MPGSGLGVDSQPYLTFQKLRHMWGEVDKREEKRQERETELALVRSGKGKRSWVEKEKKKSKECLLAGGQRHVTPNSPGDLNVPH